MKSRKSAFSETSNLYHSLGKFSGYFPQKIDCDNISCKLFPILFFFFFFFGGGGGGAGDVERNKIFQNIVCRIFYPACGASKALQMITEPVTIFTLNNRQKSLSKQ